MKNDVLIKYRKERSLSQKDLSNELGISRDFVYMLENNKRRPGLQVAKKIADYFNTTMEELFIHKNCIVADSLYKQENHGSKNPLHHDA